MNLKERLIRKLLDFGKKHRIFVYPTLALVAVISAISHAVVWGRGNGKRVVASIMVMVLLFTQSLFLTSSADTGNKEEYASRTDAIKKQKELMMLEEQEEAIALTQAMAGAYNVYFNIFDYDGDAITIDIHETYDGATGKMNKTDAQILSEVLTAQFGSNYSTYINPTGGERGAGFYLNNTKLNTDGVDNEHSVITETGASVILTIFPSRSKYDLVIKDELGGLVDKIIPITVATDGSNYQITGGRNNINPAFTYKANISDAVPNDSTTKPSATDPTKCRYGYDFLGLEYNGSPVSNGNTINVEPDQKQNVIEMTSKWQGKDITVTYDFEGKDEDNKEVPFENSVKTSDTVTYTYGSNAVLAGSSLVGDNVKNDGYYLAGWSIDNDGEVDYELGQEVNSKLLDENTVDKQVAGTDPKGITLHAVWSYKQIQLVDSNASSSGKNLVYTAHYGDSININPEAQYLSGDAGSKFVYRIVSTALQDYPADYNLVNNNTEVNDAYAASLVNLSSDRLKAITTDTSQITFSIYVADKNRKTDSGAVIDGITYYEESFDVTVNILPREVTMLAGSVIVPDKLYDGDLMITIRGADGINETAAKVDNVANGDSDTADIYVKLNKDAKLDDPNAKSGKAITVTVQGLAGNKASYYKLVDGSGTEIAAGTEITIPGVATVIPVQLQYKIVNADDTSTVKNIKFGEDRPKYKIEVIGGLVGNDRGKCPATVEPDAAAGNFHDILGFSGLSVTDAGGKAWTRYGNGVGPFPVTYSVTASFNSDGKNYVLTREGGNSSSFTVSRDGGKDFCGFNVTPVEIKDDLGNVTIVYPADAEGNVYIEPKGGYSQIRGAINSTLTDVNDSDAAAPSPGWEKSFKVPKMKDGYVEVQMMADNGAVTEIYHIGPFSVDNAQPIFKEASIKSPGMSYINNNDNTIHFGAYYNQSNGSMITISVEYTPGNSNCKELHVYFLNDKGINASGGERVFTMIDNKCDFTITAGEYGQLVIYAVSDIGIKSPETRLKLKYDGTNGLGDNTSGEYYEWMIENTIKSADIMVYGEDAKNAASTNSVWYNKLVSVVDAEDTESGLYKLEWRLIDSKGTVVKTVTELATASPDSYTQMTQYGKVTKRKFSTSFYDEKLPAGSYYVEATLYDNAGNSVVLTKKGPYLLDCVAPVITDRTVVNGSGAYMTSLDYKFSVTDADSGVANVKLMLDKGDGKPITLNESWSSFSDCSFTINTDGTYLVVATDKAGNSKTYSRTFRGISTVKPSDPKINVTGTKGKNSWYIKEYPKVTISGAPYTSDGVPVTLNYKLTYDDGNVVTNKTTTGSVSVPVTTDGSIKIETWGTSQAGVDGQIVTDTIKVDTKAPEIKITNATGSSGKTNVTFSATDAGNTKSASGVDKNSVTVNGIANEVTGTATYTGVFTATGSSKYTIEVADIAGNRTKLDFVPFDLKANPVTYISDTTAYVDAYINKGTYDIAEYYIAIKKHSSGKYSKKNVTTEDTATGKHIECDFTKLSPDTVYDYKIYARTVTSGESREITGSFRTQDNNSKASITGNVTYADNLSATEKLKTIYVGLYSGNVLVASESIDPSVQSRYDFDQVRDGSYTIKASNGRLKASAMVTVKNGLITYPEDYADNFGVNLELSGLSTNVVIDDGAVNVAVDGLDLIYSSTDFYKGCITDEDLDTIAQGGYVDVTFHASYLSNISQTEQAIFKSEIGENAVIRKYLQLYVTKEVYNADDALIRGPLNVTELYDAVTVAIPLGDLAGQRVYVASLHGDSSDYTFNLWDNADDAVISHDYVTIQTRYFSIYALYQYEGQTKDSYTVKWVDGNGKVMKTEKVTAGESATPPKKTPTKAESANYYYVFSSWDTDYKAIYEDTVITAWFVAVDKNSTTTEQPDDPSNPNKPIVVPPNKKPNYGYLGSADSPNTGDETPIAVVSLLMIGSIAGIAVLRKKAKND